MSRAYDFAVEISPVQESGEESLITQEVEQELGADEIESWYEPDSSTKTTFISGSCQLCGGESEREAASRLEETIRKNFPNVTEIVTKWRCMEYLEWDEVYTWEAE